MSDKNILTKFKLSLEYNNDDEAYLIYCTKEILRHLTVYDKIYSYLVTTHWTNDGFKELQLQYLISQNDKYNTIDSLMAATEIIQYISYGYYHNSTTRYLCFKQPSLDLLVQLYTPLVKSLSISIYNKWNKYFELEDLEDICYNTIIILYNKGYYLHKNLIQKVFYNDIYIQLRTLKHFGNIQSLNTSINDNDADDEELTLQDTLEDITAQDDYRAVEEGSANEILEARRALVLGLISVRVYDQLVFAMKHNTCDKWVYDQIYNIKKKLRSNNNGDY